MKRVIAVYTHNASLVSGGLARIEKGQKGTIDRYEIITWEYGMITYGRAGMFLVIEPVYVDGGKAAQLGYQHEGEVYSTKAEAERVCVDLREQGVNAVIVPVAVMGTIFCYAIGRR
jgi:hypothetical protein